jgi:cytochrome c
MMMLRTTWIFVLLAATAGALCAQDAKPVSFEKEVLPLLKASCFDCHQGAVKNKRGEYEEPDGGLALDGKLGILRGGDSGRAVTPWKSDKSLLYIRCTLDRDHPDVMPASGDLLTKDQLGLLKRWIDEGADFGTWVGASAEKVAPPKKTAESALAKRWQALAAGLKPLAAHRIEGLKFPGRIEPVYAGSPLLRVSVYGVQAQVDAATIAALGPISGHIAQLKLGGTEVGDSALTTVAKMKRLVDLDLSRSKVSAKGIAKIAGLSELRSLNLHHTAVGAKALAAIEAMPKLKKVYLWNAGLDARALAELRARKPKLEVVGAPSLPLPARPAENDGNRRRRR